MLKCCCQTRKELIEWVASNVPCDLFLLIRASVPKLNLDDVFEQKSGIAEAVADEREKVSHIMQLEPVVWGNKNRCG